MWWGRGGICLEMGKGTGGGWASGGEGVQVSWVGKRRALEDPENFKRGLG